jgi:glycosyltransferase involved in cell wall biosynthesis
MQGGQGLNLYHMMQAFKEAFDLSIYCSTAPKDVAAHQVPDSQIGKLINRLPFIRRLRDWQTWFSDTHFDQYVAAHLTPAHLFQGVTGQCAEGLLVAKSLGCRTVLDVVTFHIEDFAAQQERECARFNVRPSIHKWLKEKILAEYQRANLIRVMSKRAKNTFLARGFADDRVVVATPPLDMAEFPEAKFDEPKFRVSFVGLIEPWKGFHYLVEAFNALKLQDSELVLWGGPGSRSVSQYLQEHMARNPSIIIRPVSVRQFGYGNVYGKSSVFVHPSLADGFGYVVAEAMASGLPVIVTEATGAADLVIDGENGYIVPAGDRDAICDRLRHLAEHPHLLRKMGQAARATARSLTLEAFRQCLIPRLNALAS